MFKANTYSFRINIGNAKDNTECFQFTIHSNKPIEQVLAAHHKIKELTGIDINDICQKKNCTTIYSDTIDILEKLGFPIEQYSITEERNDEDFVVSREMEIFEDTYMDIYLFLLETVDPDLILSYEYTIPVMLFNTYRTKDIPPIGNLGYGLTVYTFDR